MERAWKVGTLIAASCGWLAMFGTPAYADDPPQDPYPGGARTAEPRTELRPAPDANGGSNELVALAEKVFDLADLDGDGRVSKAEALGTASFYAGGFFLRADADEDGTVTPSEAAESLQGPMSQPLVAEVVTTLRNAGGQNPVQQLSRVLDVEHGQPLTVKEARAASRRGVDALFATGDTNRDGALSRDELRAVAVRMNHGAPSISFSAADTNHDGTIDRDELEAVALVPIRDAFEKADADGDGKLSAVEVQVAMRLLNRELGARQPPRVGPKPVPQTPPASPKPDAPRPLPSPEQPAPVESP